MNDYEARQEARRERYERKAEQLRAEAGRLHDQAHDMASVIPPPQTPLRRGSFLHNYSILLIFFLLTRDFMV